MPRITARAETRIAAPADVVYGILADYRHSHARILPPAWFSDLVVEEGGRGAGTQIRFRIRLLGRDRTVRARVEEPEPGRILTETDVETGAVTSFLVHPARGGGGCDVAIVTRWTTPGPKGVLEALAAPPLLRRIYRRELRLLAEEAVRRASELPA